MRSVLATSWDVWWCAYCCREWKVRSHPHRPLCSRCGHVGWFRRFVAGEPYHWTPKPEAPCSSG